MSKNRLITRDSNILDRRLPSSLYLLSTILLNCTSCYQTLNNVIETKIIIKRICRVVLIKKYVFTFKMV